MAVLHGLVVAAMLVAPAPEPAPAPAPEPGPEPAPPAAEEASSFEPMTPYEQRGRLLLDGTVVLSVLTLVGTAAVVTGAVLIGTAGRDPDNCGGIEAPSCDANTQRGIGNLVMIPGIVVAVPSAMGLGFVAHELREHRARKRGVEARLGLGSVTLRF